MKRRILLTGKTGQVGSELLRLLPALGEVFAPGRHELDLLSAGSIRQAVREIRPDLIINAAAYTAVDAAETHEADAYAVNATAPGVLAEEAQRIGAVLVHYSTDYVFDGSQTKPYVETDGAAPINVYGKTKLAGEQAVRASGVPCLILRTSWVYSTRGRNFLSTILRLATEREELRIVRDQFGAPTRSAEIAQATVKILAQLAPQSAPLSALFLPVSGIYHLTAQGETSWYGFACAILDEAALFSPDALWFADATSGRPLVTRQVIPISSAEYPTPASRPASSVLSNSRLFRTFGIALPDWRSQLRRLFESQRVAPLPALRS